MQFYRGDDREKRFYEGGRPLLSARSAQKTTFFNQAYFCHLLGDLIVEDIRSPLARAIPEDVFRSTFPGIFEAFVQGGTAEAYLTVFNFIFGADADVTFTIPAPGKLEIDIVATGTDVFDLLHRFIEDDEYQFGELIVDEDDKLAVQVIRRFVSQYELEQVLFELVPAGVFTDINLTIGVPE